MNCRQLVAMGDAGLAGGLRLADGGEAVVIASVEFSFQGQAQRGLRGRRRPRGARPTWRAGPWPAARTSG